MDIYKKIIETYPELSDKDFSPIGSINLQDDCDGLGVYIAKWEYSEPLPKGLKLGKPSA
jgi:hypothetical protein